jgi:hypothetical protein
VTGNQYSVVRTGFEPVIVPYFFGCLLLNGFEPYPPCLRCFTISLPDYISCDPEEIRTPGPYVKSILLYQLSYEVILNYKGTKSFFNFQNFFLRKIQDSNLWDCYILRFSKPLQYHSANLPSLISYPHTIMCEYRIYIRYFFYSSEFSSSCSGSDIGFHISSQNTKSFIF